MVDGFDRFAEHFAANADQYALIGGAACTLAMEDAGQSFRATKNLDIVLCMESLQPEFVAAFWESVRAGAHQIQEKATGQRQYYHFQKPASGGHPFMLQLFSRTPGAFFVRDDSHLLGDIPTPPCLPKSIEKWPSPCVVPGTGTGLSAAECSR